MRLSWPRWRRRTPGRHELGAAVTALPSRVESLVGSIAWPSAAALPPPAAVTVPLYAAPAAPTADLGRYAEPLVSLGFRDGSTATLDPASLQARALQQLASSLTTTD